jgi:DNA-binding MarR family transcriptional regulator
MDSTDHDLLDGPLPPALAGYTGYLLRRAYQRAYEHAVALLPEGRHPRDIAILTTLRIAGPVSQRRLGELLGINRSIVVKLVDTLERDGLVRRLREPADRRHYALHLTALGLATQQELAEAAGRAEEMFTAPLTDGERERFNELLGLLVPEHAARLPAELSSRSGFLVVHAHSRLRGEGVTEMRRLGLAPQHFGLLATLSGIEPCSQRQLATAIGVSGPAIVAAVGVLEKRGLVSRERNPEDRREHLLRLAPPGRTALADATALADRLHAELAERIGRDEVAELNRLLTKLVG